MKNDIKLLEELLEKIRNTSDEIIEQAIDDLSTELIKYSVSVEYINKNIERENTKWKENLQLAA